MHWFRNLRIGIRLLASFLLVAILCGVVGVVGIINIRNISTADSALYEKNTLGVTYISNAAVNYQKVKNNALLLTTADDTYTDTYITNIKNYADMADFYLAKYAQLASGDDKDIYEKLLNSWRDYAAAIKSAADKAHNGDMSGAAKAINQSSATGYQLENIYFKQLMENNESQAEGKNRQNLEQAQFSVTIMLGIVAVSFVSAVWLGIFVARSISRPVKKLSAAADKLASGDTGIEFAITTSDEIGKLSQAFRRMTAAIKNLIDDTHMLAQAAVEGRLSVRADATRHHGDYAKIVEGFNKTLDAVIAPVEEAAGVLDQVASGRLDSTVSGDFNGDHAKIKNAINETVGALRSYIDETSAVLGDMANGDFTSEISSDFKGDFSELKDSVNAIVHAMNATLREIDSSAEQVASGTRQISDGSQMISEGASEQASAIEELSVSITQLAAQTRQNADNALHANALTFGAKSAATQGNGHMADMQAAMAAINDSSGNISRIIKVIDDIAFQTNILALNAAVEAARAGAQGKGFAVVAEEVRSLAGRSAEAAKETAALIEGSQKKTKAGMLIADKTLQAFEMIVKGIDDVTTIVAGIADASGEQAAAISQVNRGIAQLSTVVQTNSATAQQAAAVSEELSNQADMLKGMVHRFILMTRQATANAEVFTDEAMLLEPVEDQGEDFGDISL